MAAQVDPVGLDGVDVQVLPREAIVTQLAVFLDERTRPHLSLAQLKMLQDIKSSTERSEWKEMRAEARRMAACSPQGLKPHPLLSDDSSLHKSPGMSPLTLEPPADNAPNFFVSPKGHRLRSNLSSDAAAASGGANSTSPILSFQTIGTATSTPTELLSAACRSSERRAALAAASGTLPAAEEWNSVSGVSPPDPATLQRIGGNEVDVSINCPNGSLGHEAMGTVLGGGGIAGSGQVGSDALGHNPKKVAKEQPARADSELSGSATTGGLETPPGTRSLGSDTPPQARGPLDARLEGALREELHVAREEAQRCRQESEQLRSRVCELEARLGSLGMESGGASVPQRMLANPSVQLTPARGEGAVQEGGQRYLWDESDEEDGQNTAAATADGVSCSPRRRGGHRRQLSSPLIARLQDTITGEANDIDRLTKQLLDGDEEELADPGSLLDKISSLKQDIGTVTSFSNLKHHQGLASILNQVSIYEEYLKSLRGEAHGAALSAKERAYEMDAAAQFDLVEVPPDGSCLFMSVGLHLHALSLQIWGEGLGPSSVQVPAAPLAQGETPPPTAHRTGLLPFNETMLPWEATAQTRMLPQDKKAQIAAQVRAEVVAILLQGGRASEERVGREIGEALRGERSDPTSQALRAEAAKVWGEGDQPDDVLASERGLEIYARVMAREGLFGERLELETLSVCVGAPVFVYYYPGQHSIGAPIAPSEVFGRELPGEPVRLLHSIKGNHFQLLRPRPPTGSDSAGRGAERSGHTGAVGGTCTSPEKKGRSFLRFFLCS